MSILSVGYLISLVQLARSATARRAFYLGLAVGLFTVGPQLNCFWRIFGAAAIALWLLLAFWIGLFVTLARLCLRRFGSAGVWLMPTLWTGLEYFRSELYYLRFSWLNVGYSFSGSSLLPLFHWAGMYGIGFLAMTVAVALVWLRPKRATALALGLTLLFFISLPAFRGLILRSQRGREVNVAGIQLEFPTVDRVIAGLDKLRSTAPAAELYVLSEYTFDGPVPQKVLDWCRGHEKYVIVGGKAPAPGSNFYDTAFVVAPSGDIAFRQVKSVPIQFFRDGLPAPEQNLWASPWGKIGLCVCYDLSYTRVTDGLIRMGAQAIIVPTMDVVDWGRREHELHGMVAPVRSAEYGVPIFRLASSGISQSTSWSGHETVRASFPGQGEIVRTSLVLGKAGRLPLDRWLAPAATAASGALILWLIVDGLRNRKRRLAS